MDGTGRDTSAAATGRDSMAVVAWCSAAALLATLAAVHLSVLVTFAIGAAVSPLLVPLATLAGALLAWRAGLWCGLARQPAALVPAVVAIVLLLGAALAGSFYDMTWDGQWYHQTAVYRMAAGWNPLREPILELQSTWRLWMLHYAKGPWYVAFAIYQMNGSIELAKAASAIVPMIAGLAVFAAALDHGLERRWALLVALLATLNPVTTCGIVTHQVDGMLVSFLLCAVAAGLCYLRQPTWLAAWVVALSAILCVNTKFTGVVYVCFFALAGVLWCAWRQRSLLPRFGALVATALIVGTLVFGYNPYVTNFVHRGHPFYPMQGSAAFPSLADQGQDPIERWETPRNMLGRSRVVRLAYGIFGRAGTAPFVTQDAEFMFPFAATTRDFALYYFHDVRIGGFGPLFSGVLILTLGLTAWACVRRAIPCGAVALLCGIILASLLVSTHTWWARYGPHLWWVPVICLAALLRTPGRSVMKNAAVALASVLLANALVIWAVHMRWEWRCTSALSRQLADLKDAGALTVDLQYFDVPVAERFRTNGIAFTPTTKQPCPPERQVTLQSVARGYPGAVQVCLADAGRVARLQSLPHWQWSKEP